MSDSFGGPARPPGAGRPGRPGGPGRPGRPAGFPGSRRRPSPLLLTAVVLLVLFLGASLFTNIWTEKLWFSSVGYGSVFTTLLWTRIALFVAFGTVMALVVGASMAVAYRLRPPVRPNTPDQASLDRYREVIVPMRRVLLVVVSLVLGVFAGVSSSGQWRTFSLWRNRESFGTKDPYFHRDIGFYFFSLPWFHYVVDFLTTALVVAVLAAVLVHYLFGGIRLSGPGKLSGGAQVQISLLVGTLLLLKSVDYWLDRFDLTTQQGKLITGMTYARDNAVLPSKNILMFIALICALLFFANVILRTWLLPTVGVGLLALSAVLLGVIWPAIVQRYQVDPSVADKEAPYIKKNITATRDAYGLADVKTTTYAAATTLSRAKLRADAASLPGIRLVDPQLVSPTFEQLQQVRGYYSVPSVLDVDRYTIDGRERDMVVTARELNLEGLSDDQKNWTSEHTIYTHGYGMIAAYGNQRNAEDQAVSDSQGVAPVWAEQSLPPVGQLSDLTKKGYKPQIYFGEQSDAYSIVGRPKGAAPVELDLPGTSKGQAQNTVYDGKGGVKVDTLFRKALYALKFGDSNILLSSRVGENSKILYDRQPLERVQKVAPWLTFDHDALPSVVDGRIVWILDGYTTSDRYPLSEARSLEEMTTDALNPQQTYATLPTDHINYMRNAVKATVDAYDGTVTLYGWDEKDPMLKAWKKVFPGVVKPKSAISPDLLNHLRYPEDMYKVQRNIYADYHVSDPRTFFQDSDKWDVPQDPEQSSRTQPPYRLSVAPESNGKPTFSLTSVYVPAKKSNLASFMSVGSDAADSKTYGKFTVLRLPDDYQVAGPSQIANQFNSDDKIANALLPFKRNDDVQVKYGNLLTLPVGKGLLYVQPLYTLRTGGAASYPRLQFVLVSFGDDVGIGGTLSEALDNALGSSGGTGDDSETSDTTGDTGSGSDSGSDSGGSDTSLSGSALALLKRADAEFAAADKALRDGDTVEYAKRIEAARKLVAQAVAKG